MRNDNYMGSFIRTRSGNRRLLRAFRINQNGVERAMIIAFGDHPYQPIPGLIDQPFREIITAFCRNVGEVEEWIRNVEVPENELDF